MLICMWSLQRYMYSARYSFATTCACMSLARTMLAAECHKIPVI